MKTLNSISGGKTSAYIAANYPADFNIFSLVRTTDKDCLFMNGKDEKTRQLVSDKLGTEFIGTLEMDEIVYTILDLEQYIGREITWVTGKHFDEVIIRGEDKKYLPNKVQRFCTVEMKIKPMFEWWASQLLDPTETRIGFRANEQRRAKSMLERTNEDGLVTFKTIVGTHEKSGRNKWAEVPYQKPVFPLIQDGIFKDKIEAYWKDKPVRFAYMNNCVGCFHRNPVLLKHMSNKCPNKFEWFAKQEREMGYISQSGGFIDGMTYDQIRARVSQMKLFDDDFNECDSGYCGL